MEYNTATSSLLELPSELTLELVATIPAQQVVVLMRACSQLNALLSGDQLWRGLALRDFDVLRQLVDYYATNKAVHQPTGWLVLYRSYASLPSAPPPIKFRVGEGTIAETTTSSGGTTYESGGTTYFLATHLLIEALLPLPEQVKLSQFVFTFVVEFEGAEGESLMLRKVCSYDQFYTENTEPWSHDSGRQPGGQLNLIDSTCACIRRPENGFGRQLCSEDEPAEFDCVRLARTPHRQALLQRAGESRDGQLYDDQRYPNGHAPRVSGRGPDQEVPTGYVRHI